MTRRWTQGFLPRFEKTVRIWLAVYPTVLVVLTLTIEMLVRWPFALRVLVSTMIIVTIVANVTEPLVAFVFRQVGARRRFGRASPELRNGKAICPQQYPHLDQTKEFQNVETKCQPPRQR